MGTGSETALRSMPMDPETPEADAAEQLRAADEDTEEEDTVVPGEVRDADPGDVAEQLRGVPEEEPYERG